MQSPGWIYLLKVVTTLVESVIVSLLIDFPVCLMTTLLIPVESWITSATSLPILMPNKMNTAFLLDVTWWSSYLPFGMSVDFVWVGSVDGVVMEIWLHVKTHFGQSNPLTIAIGVLCCSRIAKMVGNNVQFIILKATWQEKTWIIIKYPNFAFTYIWCIEIQFFLLFYQKFEELVSKGLTHVAIVLCKLCVCNRCVLVAEIWVLDG